MDSLVDRWKHAINSAEELTQSRNTTSLPKQNASQIQNINTDTKQNLKKLTPSKKKLKNKDKIIEGALSSLLELFSGNNSQKIKIKSKSILEELWGEALLEKEKEIEHYDMKQSVTSSSAKQKMQEKSYIELEKKYFDCEKQRQYFKNKVDSLMKKYENIEREIEKYSKIEKLIDNTIERQSELKRQVIKLKRELEVADLKQIEQQKIFRKEVITIHELISSIKSNLPSE